MRGFRKQRTDLGAGFGQPFSLTEKWPFCVARGCGDGCGAADGVLRRVILDPSRVSPWMRGPVSSGPGPLPALAAAFPSLTLTGRDTRPGPRGAGESVAFAAAVSSRALNGRDTRPGVRRRGEQGLAAAACFGHAGVGGT
ncbi:hypothetical protein GCM10009603_00920 [Nocardiopsis exhalans]